MVKSTEWSDDYQESDEDEGVDSEEDDEDDDDESGEEEEEEEEDSSDDEGAEIDSEDEEIEGFEDEPGDNEHIETGDEECIEAGTCARDVPKSSSDDKNNAMATVVCCCCLIIILAVVLGVTLGGEEDSMPTPAPVMQTSPPKFSPMPSSPPTRNPSARPTATPTELIPEKLLIFAEADTFIADDSIEPEVTRLRGQNETSLLVQKGMNNSTGISNSYALISFDISKIPDPENIFKRTAKLKRTWLKLTHIASGPENSPVNITIVRLPSTPFQLESLHAGLFTPSGGVDGPTIYVAPSDTVLDIDITDLITPTLETQLFLMLKASSQNPEGDRFYSRESSRGKPELIVDLGEALSTPSLSSTPTITATLSPETTASRTDLCHEETKEEYLLSVLTPITPEDVLLNPNTPQGKAFAYMLNRDPYLENPCGKDTIQQRYGLTTLYFATSGQSWTNTLGWLGEDQECAWHGITCDSNKQVAELELSINNLQGELPDELSTLFMLERLDLFANSIEGTLPDGFRDLARLQVLDMQENLLEGPAFPDSITQLNELQSYRVNTNKLTGPVPSEIGKLRSLEELWASGNDISGMLPTELGNLRDLKTILLHENTISGALPSELGLIPLEGMWLYSNNIQATIPWQLFNVASLTSLRLESNFFYGTLPEQIGQLTDIQDLRLHQNNLSGQIPSQVGTMTSLEILKINDNYWLGSIPDVFQDYKNLWHFDISENMVTGTIPKTVFSSPELQLAYMSNCSLSGRIPNEYSKPPKLRDLYLNGNRLTGTVPSIRPGELTLLNEFLVYDTFIDGTMPESVCSLRFEHILDDLWSDCGGQTPEIECDFPDCCNRCFEGHGVMGRRLRRERPK